MRKEISFIIAPFVRPPSFRRGFYLPTQILAEQKFG